MKIIDYVKETKAELRHVSWPSRKQAMGFTLVTVIVSIAVAVYLGIFDYIFSQILRIVI